jgi:hypothetical protein
MTIQPRWKFASHMATTKEHSILYQDKELHVTHEVHTPCGRRFGEFGKAKIYYFIDGDKREFTTEAELIAALEQNEAPPCAK